MIFVPPLRLQEADPIYIIVQLIIGMRMENSFIMFLKLEQLTGKKFGLNVLNHPYHHVSHIVVI